MITQDELKSLLKYDPETGVFTYLRRSGTRSAGAVAGSKSKSIGYVLIGVGGKQRVAHRLAWLYMTGSFPPCDIDHIDMDKANNKWSNLRLATRSQNCANTGIRRNNTIGFKGVSKSRNKFAARITVNYQVLCLGVFSTKEEASAAYQRAASNNFGEFARH